MDLSQRLRRLRKTFDLMRRGAQVFRSTGMRHSLSPMVALKLARDSRKGRKGTLAVVHLHALADPLRPAIVALGPEEVRLNYGELEQRINRLTHGLRSLGIGPGERIGAFLHNTHEYLELTAALGALGGVSVQIGYRLKAAEVAYLLENSGARALIFHADLAPVVEEALKEVTKLSREACVALGRAPGFRSYEDLLASPGCDPMEPAFVAGGGFGGVMVYTSGTTGKSKGATRDLKKMGVEPILNFISQFPLSRDERHLWCARFTTRRRRRSSPW